ncbi:hypothetical protein HK100_006195 [Physocladia obscura]|uniref:Homeobox domain-containing protein n=1 Tax=Physocladia obscura TaxID=109957 RepID=A0AAD5TB94_9FUNG|nr:hypothetical protein HK100_006195 [Physocladia obscura]
MKVTPIVIASAASTGTGTGSLIGIGPGRQEQQGRAAISMDTEQQAASKSKSTGAYGNIGISINTNTTTTTGTAATTSTATATPQTQTQKQAHLLTAPPSADTDTDADSRPQPPASSTTTTSSSASRGLSPDFSGASVLLALSKAAAAAATTTLKAAPSPSISMNTNANINTNLNMNDPIRTHTSSERINKRERVSPVSPDFPSASLPQSIPNSTPYHQFRHGDSYSSSPVFSHGLAAPDPNNESVPNCSPNLSSPSRHVAAATITVTSALAASSLETAPLPVSANCVSPPFSHVVNTASFNAQPPTINHQQPLSVLLAHPTISSSFAVAPYETFAPATPTRKIDEPILTHRPKLPSLSQLIDFHNSPGSYPASVDEVFPQHSQQQRQNLQQQEQLPSISSLSFSAHPTSPNLQSHHQYPSQQQHQQQPQQQQENFARLPSPTGSLFTSSLQHQQYHQNTHRRTISMPASFSGNGGAGVGGTSSSATATTSTETAVTTDTNGGPGTVMPPPLSSTTAKTVTPSRRPGHQYSHSLPINNAPSPNRQLPPSSSSLIHQQQQQQIHHHQQIQIQQINQGLSPRNTIGGGQYKPKFKYNDAQKAILLRAFEVNSYPNYAGKEELGKLTGTTATQVQFWFQNQRQKVARLMNGGVETGSGGSGGSAVVGKRKRERQE